MGDFLQGLGGTCLILALVVGLCQVAQIGVLIYRRADDGFDSGELQITVGGFALLGLFLVAALILAGLGAAVD